MPASDETLLVNPDISQALQRCKTLPTLPTIAVRLLELYEQRDSVDVRQLANDIGLDPPTAAKLIRLANSPYFGTGREVTSLLRAVALLGTSSVLAVALSFVLVGSRRRSDDDRFDGYYWKRSLLSALAARVVARHAGRDAEEAFLAALLQDIGMLALKEVLPSSYAPFVAGHLDRPHVELDAAERAAFDTDHAEVGAELARRWKLPATITSVIAASHDPARAAPAHAGLVRAVWLSGLFADTWTQRDTASASHRSFALMQERFGVDRSVFDAVMADMAGAIPELSGMFEMELLAPSLIEGVLAQAREALVQVSLEATVMARQAESTVSKLEDEKRAMQSQAERDALTGLSNRAHLESELQAAFALAQRTGEPLSVAFCDIDFFKRVNDTYGHQAGDQVLVAVGRALERSAYRSDRGDLVGRLGGEEFVIVLPGTGAEAARVVAERARKAVAAEVIATDRVSVQVTISIGVATLDGAHPFDDPAALLARADGCLYGAKRAGRNRVVLAGESEDEG